MMSLHVNSRYKKLTVIFVFLFSAIIFISATKERQVTGIVVDDRNQPIAGVHVVLKNTLIATATDLDGTYSIIANENDTLIFSASGYDTKQIAVENYTVINVTLTETLTRLNADIFLRNDKQEDKEFIITRVSWIHKALKIKVIQI